MKIRRGFHFFIFGIGLFHLNLRKNALLSDEDWFYLKKVCSAQS